jgi:TPP-dependent trihydroxycyclohexane-1,2-dione (THcHDO) dehydratase
MKMIIPIKLYAYGAILLAIGGAYWRYTHVMSKNEELEEKIIEVERTRDTALASVMLYHENREKQAKLIEEYQVKLDEKQAANSALERDVAANVKQLRVKASCKPSDTATTNTATTEANAQLDSSVRPDYFSLRRGIVELEERYSLCLQILNEDRKKP